MRATTKQRLARIEHRLRHRICGVHRYSDHELDGLIAWLKNPEPSAEGWAVALFRREGLIP